MAPWMVDGTTASLCDAVRVRFEFEQRWPAPADDVMGVYLDPTFWSGLSGLATTAPPQVLGIERDDRRATVQLRWVLTVDLPPDAARFLDPEHVSWVERTTWDLASRRAEVAFLPDRAGGLLRASAVAALLGEGDGTVRRIEGDLSVRIPLVGRRVERAIVDGVVRHLTEEEAAVDQRLRS